MISIYEIAGIAAVGGAAVMAGGVLLVKVLKSKGIDVEVVEKKLDSGLQFAEQAADALAPFIPAPYNAIVKTITSAAAKTVETTEALTKAGLMSADQRKAAATNIIIADMEAEKLPVDDNVKKLISVAIDSAALLLPGHLTTTATATTTAATATASPTDTAASAQ